MGSSSQNVNGTRRRRLIKANALVKRGIEWNATIEYFLRNVWTVKTVVEIIQDYFNKLFISRFNIVKI